MYFKHKKFLHFTITYVPCLFISIELHSSQRMGCLIWFGHQNLQKLLQKKSPRSLSIISLLLMHPSQNVPQKQNLRVSPSKICFYFFGCLGFTFYFLFGILLSAALIVKWLQSKVICLFLCCNLLSFINKCSLSIFTVTFYPS